MKVKIGPYRGWFGPYQFADLLQYVGFSEDFCVWLGSKLPEGPFDWIDSFKERKIKVKLHPYDTWSMDHTLALIIHPMLVQLKATKHGAPFTDDEDVPEGLRKTSAPPVEHEWDTDDNFFLRWDYILEEMIWTFNERLDDYDTNEPSFTKDREAYDAYHARMKNGFRLFGKYYTHLWD